MRYCVRCILPSTAPGAVFSSSGVCHACVAADEPHRLPPEARIEAFRDLVAVSREAAEGPFDCVLGVSGGKDSLRQALWLRDAAEVHPLLVCLAAPPEHNTEIGAANLENLIRQSVDLVVTFPAPETWRALCLEAFRAFGNYAVATELALYAAAPRVAIERGIHTVVIGENPSLRDPSTVGLNPWEYQDFAKQRTLRGGDISWVPKSIRDTPQFMAFQVPSAELLSCAGVQVLDLAWFIDGWTNDDNARFAASRGLRVRDDHPMNSGDLVGVSALDDSFVDVNQMIKYFKFGFGKTTDYLNERIRHGTLERGEAAVIASKYDGACSSDRIEAFADYLRIGVDEFWATVYRFVDWNLFRVSSLDPRPQPTFEVGRSMWL